MNKETKQVLLIEDEEGMALAVKQALHRSTRYTFETTHLAHLRKEDVEAIRNKSFDLCIVDLQLQEGGPEKWGFLATLVEAYRHPASRVIVYSAHPDIDNVVKAMRLGAWDFIAKADCPPDQLPGRLEKMLEEERQASELIGEQDQAFKKHGERWQREYAGLIVAVVGDQVVASGEGHLETLLDYAEKRQKGSHSSWPEIPQFTEIPTE